MYIRRCTIQGLNMDSQLCKRLIQSPLGPCIVVSVVSWTSTVSLGWLEFACVMGLCAARAQPCHEKHYEEEQTNRGSHLMLWIHGL